MCFCKTWPRRVYTLYFEIEPEFQYKYDGFMKKREIYDILVTRIAKGELAFPTSAQLALRVRQTLDDPDCTIDAAVKLIQAEPLLAARAVAMANSVVYNRSGREITDIRASVERLGFRTVRSLAMALVTRQMAGKSLSSTQQQLADQLWEHTTHVASLAQIIARRVTHQDPEAALFAGLIHEVGGFYMISCAQEFPTLLENDFTDWIEYGEVKVGRAVLKVLAVPKSIETAIETYWNGFLEMPSVSLADTLLLAENLAPTPSPLHHIENCEPGDEAMARIEMAIGEEMLSAILEESAGEVKSLTDALKF